MHEPVHTPRASTWPHRALACGFRVTRHDVPLLSAPTAGQSSAGQVEALREEIAQLRTAMERRPVIDMARGILMALWSCSEDDAWEILVDVSQHSNTKLHDVAEAVVTSVQGEPLPPASTEPPGPRSHQATRALTRAGEARLP